MQREAVWDVGLFMTGKGMAFFLLLFRYVHFSTYLPFPIHGHRDASKAGLAACSLAA
jgi:hypothetical protein